MSIKIRKRSLTGNFDHSKWQIIKMDDKTWIYSRVVDEAIIKQMPSSTETIVERGIFDAFRKRMRKFVQTGS